MVPGIRKYRSGTGVWIVALEGDHDIQTAPHVRETLQRAAETHTGVVVDLTALTFIDSSIVRVIADGPRERFAVVVPKDGVAAQIADIMQLDTFVPVYQSAVVACRECGQGTLLVR